MQRLPPVPHPVSSNSAVFRAIPSKHRNSMCGNWRIHLPAPFIAALELGPRGHQMPAYNHCGGNVQPVFSLGSCKILLALAGTCLAIFTAVSAPAAAFECPAAQARTSSSAIKETSAQIAQLTRELEGDETGNTAMATIWELKSKYPKAGFNEIVNYMVTAYCPIVAQNASLSDDEKKDRLMRYSRQIERLAIQ